MDSEAAHSKSTCVVPSSARLGQFIISHHLCLLVLLYLPTYFGSIGFHTLMYKHFHFITAPAKDPGLSQGQRTQMSLLDWLKLQGADAGIIEKVPSKRGY